jgi:putative transposase
MMCPTGHEDHAMKTSKFTEEQIAFALKQAELGTKVEEICCKLGISEATFYNWNALGGLAGGQDEARMGWLYEKFAEKTFAELQPK